METTEDILKEIEEEYRALSKKICIQIVGVDRSSDPAVIQSLKDCDRYAFRQILFQHIAKLEANQRVILERLNKLKDV